MADLHVPGGGELQLDVAVVFQQVPGHRLELLEADDGAVVRIDRLTVAVDHEPGDLLEVAAAGHAVHDIPEGQLALPDPDGVRDALLDVELRRHAGEPPAPDDREVGVLLTHHLRGDVTVVDLVAEDAGGGEEQGALAGLVDLPEIVRLDHRVDHHDLEPVRHGAGGDLQQLERQEVRAEPLTARGVGAVGKEQDDLVLALDHREGR